MSRSIAGRLLLYALLVLTGCGYVELGCGTSDLSVTADGEDGVRVLAEEEAGGTRARIELERKTRRIVGRGEVRYLFSKRLTEQWLRVIVGDGGDQATFTPAEHDEASSFASHALEIAPDGKRVAYRLGDRPWRVVYVLTSTLAVQPREPLDVAGALDWSKVPPFDEVVAPLIRDQRLQHNQMHNFYKEDLILRFVRAQRGQAGLADVLFDLVPYGSHQLDDSIEHLLDDVGRAHLRTRLRAAVLTKAALPSQYAMAWRMDALDPAAPDDAPIVAAAAEAMSADAPSLATAGDALVACLEALAKVDARDAARIACRLRNAPGQPWALGEGRPLRVLAERLCADPG